MRENSGKAGRLPGIAFLCILLTVCFLSVSPAIAAQGSGKDGREETAQLLTEDGKSQCAPCDAFNDLNTKVRDGKISRNAAKAEAARLLSDIKQWYLRHGGTDSAPASWVFPVEGYGWKAIGGARGRGYKPKGYDYFDGDRHGGHPSFDIFIRDRNRDSLDDGTGKPVKVLSMTSGIVVAAETSWTPESRLRGGNYLWIWDPSEEILVYYAHNKELLVRPGRIIRLGDPIAHVGRTGLNAYKKRSPTHLHLTVLRVKDGYPAPVNVYENLKKCGGQSAEPQKPKKKKVRRTRW